jgi:hypothetical protein
MITVPTAIVYSQRLNDPKILVMFSIQDSFFATTVPAVYEMCQPG